MAEVELVRILKVVEKLPTRGQCVLDQEDKLVRYQLIRSFHKILQVV